LIHAMMIQLAAAVLSRTRVAAWQRYRMCYTKVTYPTWASR
jgi:hypothetical protein